MSPNEKIKKVELVPIAELRPNPKNRNKHPEEQINRLISLIEFYGFRNPIIVSNRTGLVVAGHGRLLAAKKMRMTHVPVSFQDFDNFDEEYGYGTSDNGIAAWAELDYSLINSDLGDLGPDFDVDLLGIKDFELEPADKYANKNDDVIPEVGIPTTKPGDLWLLGDHRVLCGDCTDPKNIERLMNGEKADMVFTDPPYGIGYEYNQHNDSSKEENAALVKNAFAMHKCGKVWTPGLMNLSRDISRFGPAKVAVWYKKFAQAGSGLGGASTWEPILVCNPKERNLNNDVLVVATERENVNGQSLRELHSCPKPVNLYEQLINAFTERKDLIIEPFCGSGSTLIACEKTKRKCYGMEIDPHYVDVIVKRWEDYTGKKAVLDGSD